MRYSFANEIAFMVRSVVGCARARACLWVLRVQAYLGLSPNLLIAFENELLLLFAAIPSPLPPAYNFNIRLLWIQPNNNYIAMHCQIIISIKLFTDLAWNVNAFLNRYACYICPYSPLSKVHYTNSKLHARIAAGRHFVVQRGQSRFYPCCC